MIRRLLSVLLALCLLCGTAAMAETAPSEEWVSFLLMCNEGMQNDGANVGNTMMVVALAPYTGKIRLMMLTWDTFVDYEGYDIPQLIDQPYRIAGPEETMKVFNANFGTDVERFMSLNYLNLAGLIDNYGGVNVDITRAERNALNGMVASKKAAIQAMQDSGLLVQVAVELLASEYYLEDYGADTHLNGLQAVGYGWLQYDSVYNCCLRESHVIGNLFRSIGDTVGDEVVFYNDKSGAPEDVKGRRAINLDDVTEDDMAYLRYRLAPIFNMSYNNLNEDEISLISLALVNAAYQAARQGQNIFDTIEYGIFPLEAKEPYVNIAGMKGHEIDFDANSAAIQEFLYGVRD